MQYKIFNLQLDLGRDNRDAVRPVQGESAVKLRATLTQNNGPYALTGTDVRAIFRKPDHTYSYIDASVIDATKGIIEIVLTDQVLLLSGVVVALIEVAGSIGLARTWMFTIDVQPGIPNTNLESVNEFPAVNQMIIDVAEIKATFDAIVAGVTVDGEVILARAGFTTLRDRLNDSDAKKVPTTRKVAGKALTADISLAKADVGLDKVDNTPDASKPVSTPQSEALGLKVDKLTKVNGKALSADVAIGAVDIAITDLGAYYPTDNIEAALQNAGGRIVKLESKVKIYGVSFSGSNSAGTRTHDAVGMVANAGIGDQVVQNDFDKVSFFQRPRCLVYHDATGKARVMAYEGEPGFNLQGAVFAPYTEKAQVFYEQKPFYWNEDLDWPQVSATPLEGFPLAPMFKNPADKVYLPSYWLGIDNGKACSLSGTHPEYNSINGSMTTARTYHARAHLETMAVRISEYVLQLVEFGTRDVQNVMTGAMTNRYNADDISILAETGVNRIVMANASANTYVVGQTICIGTTKNASNIAARVVITAIEIYDASNKAIIFDGPPLNIPLGAFTSTRAWRNGATDIVKASSGSPVSNTNGLYPCIWRGKVDPWAMAFSGISDVLIQRLGAGTVEDPYIYNAYQLKDPTLYNNGVIDNNWTKVNYNISGGDGYVTQMGKDPKSPAVRMPTTLGGASTTYFASYFYYARYVVSAVFVGGYWTYGRYCSPVCFSLSSAPSLSSIYRLARLFVSPS